MGLVGPGFVGAHHIDAVRRLGFVDVVAEAGGSDASAAAKAKADYSWRLDPAQGESSAMADIGSHWCDLAQHVSGQRIEAGGAVGTVTVGQVYAGHKNDLRLELCGRTGSLRWNQERQNALWMGPRRRANATLAKDP